MIRILLLSFVMIFTFMPSARAQDVSVFIPDFNGTADFRGFVWGVGKEDVKRYEKAVFYEEKEDVLSFLERPSKKDYRRLIRYNFEKNKLVRASYEFQELIPPSPEPAVDLYEAMKAAVIRVKGKPLKEEFIWGDRLYAYYPQFWGRALRAGDLRIKSTWGAGGVARSELMLGFKTPYYTLVYTAWQEGSGKDGFHAPLSPILPVFTNP